jgi:biotin carboxyl carrier protein
VRIVPPLSDGAMRVSAPGLANEAGRVPSLRRGQGALDSRPFGSHVHIDANGQRHVVEVRRAGGGWTAKVDGRELEVDVARVAGRWSLLLGPAGAGYDPLLKAAGGDDTTRPKERRIRRSYDVAFEEHGPGDLVLYVNGHRIAVTVPQLKRGPTPTGPAAAIEDAGAQSIVAPMPGRIVKVLVRPGEVVAAGQAVMVIEAMKMENELRSPKGGTIIEVRVAEGMLVEAKKVLVVVG